MVLLKKCSGQSTIEFLVTFGFTLLLIFILLKISLNVTNGFLVHYATYSASRAFLVADNLGNTPNDDLAESKALSVFGKIVAGNTVTVQPQKISLAEKSVFLGVRAEFTQKFAFSDVIGGEQPITFISESYIGRTPLMSECVIRTCDAIKHLDGSIVCDLNVTLEDNGC
ncbi:MAG: hypothetical protein HYV97_14540 [Bdellovibrio sp.]|nr:hypothetical protein [Bdellovibrio sp.]